MRALALSIETAKYIFEGGGLSMNLPGIPYNCLLCQGNSVGGDPYSPLRRVRHQS